jgi:site-specific recombinase XerD
LGITETDLSGYGAKKLERLRSIFRFAVLREWIKTNPARELKMPMAKWD